MDRSEYFGSLLLLRFICKYIPCHKELRENKGVESMYDAEFVIEFPFVSKGD